MSKGTLTLTNNSDTVTGSNTAFTSELTVGDFIVVAVGGIPYTLSIKTINSNTSLTLVSNFTGPTAGGAAWSAVPRVALNMVTAALVAQSAEALRGLNYDKQNWQQVYSAAGNITVKLPDGTTFTGPSWKYLSDNMATKSGGAVPVNQGGTGSTTAAGARTNLGLGDSATRNVGTAAGTVAAGDDSRLNTIAGKTGGTIYGRIGMSSGGIGTYLSAQQNSAIIQSIANDTSATSAVGALTWKYNNGSGFQIDTTWGSVGLSSSAWPQSYMMQSANETAYGARIWTFGMASGDIICSGSGNQGGSYSFTKSAISDRELKDDIQYNDGLQSYENVKKFLPCTFIYKDDTEGRIRRGVIAQDIREIDEEYVKEIPNYFDDTSTLALDTNVLLLDTMLALKYTIKRLEETQKELAELKNIFAGS